MPGNAADAGSVAGAAYWDRAFTFVKREIAGVGTAVLENAIMYKMRDKPVARMPRKQSGGLSVHLRKGRIGYFVAKPAVDACPGNVKTSVLPSDGRVAIEREPLRAEQLRIGAVQRAQIPRRHESGHGKNPSAAILGYSNKTPAKIIAHCRAAGERKQQA